MQDGHKPLCLSKLKNAALADSPTQVASLLVGLKLDSHQFMPGTPSTAYLGPSAPTQANNRQTEKFHWLSMDTPTAKSRCQTPKIPKPEENNNHNQQQQTDTFKPNRISTNEKKATKYDKVKQLLSTKTKETVEPSPAV